MNIYGIFDVFTITMYLNLKEIYILRFPHYPLLFLRIVNILSGTKLKKMLHCIQQYITIRNNIQQYVTIYNLEIDYSAIMVQTSRYECGLSCSGLNKVKNDDKSRET